MREGGGGREGGRGNSQTDLMHIQDELDCLFIVPHKSSSLLCIPYNMYVY